MIYCLCVFNNSCNKFSIGLSSEIFGLSMLSGMPKLSLNYLIYQSSMHVSHQ